MLGLVHGPLEIVRTRDEAALAAADFRVDIGWRSDPATGDFDHHQRGGAGERPNGIRYASFGLVWRAFGAQLRGRRARRRSTSGSSRASTPTTPARTSRRALFEGIRPLSVSGVIAAMNGVWDEELSAADEDERFAEAVALATGVLERELRGAAAYQRALALVRGAIERSADPRIVELDRKLPWHETVVTTAPEALYVIYPKSDGWGMQAVPRVLGEFENRKDLPEAWAGHSGEDLAAVTGVPDAIFAHTKRFYASAGSREGILALAAQALEA